MGLYPRKVMIWGMNRKSTVHPCSQFQMVETVTPI